MTILNQIQTERESKFYSFNELYRSFKTTRMITDIFEIQEDVWNLG